MAFKNKKVWNIFGRNVKLNSTLSKQTVYFNRIFNFIITQMLKDESGANSIFHIGKKSNEKTKTHN